MSKKNNWLHPGFCTLCRCRTTTIFSKGKAIFITFLNANFSLVRTTVEWKIFKEYGTSLDHNHSLSDELKRTRREAVVLNFFCLPLLFTGNRDLSRQWQG